MRNKFIINKVPASDAQKNIVDELADRARQVREKLVEPEKDNMLKIVNDGRKLALDQRLINPDLPDAPNSKVNICVKNVLEVYEATKEQRSGRIIRQGNENKHVKIFRYVTEGTFDSYLWEILENKQRFISQIMTSKTPARSADDIDEATLSYAEIKAIATVNPLIKKKMDTDVRLERIKLARSEFLHSHEQLLHKFS